ncbi:hypothetical protein [Streptantibioticus ferralitis]|uniref:Uncharacterized protein n=1 Tax=Streptantibioticus ferralitis TaxID=236510 RepID=A0ABT5Z789_9ACTN|nr:hypothetical protein [Streptantibioticus ferralitis]MDF2259694.1 hypothetical protein [Streptantibioticus ferralitis]
MAQALPAWIHPLGASVQVPGAVNGQDATAWSIRLSQLTSTTPSDRAAGLPHGWRAAKAQVTFTNATDQIQSLPRVELTARYGAAGRPAVEFTDPQTGINGIPQQDPASGDTPRAAPQGSLTATIGVALPASTEPSDATVTFTLHAWIAGEGSSRAPLFFEGGFPGATRSIAQPLQTRVARKTVLALGEWNDDGDTRLRLAPVHVDGPSAGGQRACSMDLTVINDASDDSLTTSMSTIVNISYGQALTQGPSIGPGPGPDSYADAPIAPGRAATETLHFTLPASAIPGPVTIDVGDGEGSAHRVTYEGTVE